MEKSTLLVTAPHRAAGCTTDVTPSTAAQCTNSRRFSWKQTWPSLLTVKPCKALPASEILALPRDRPTTPQLKDFWLLSVASQLRWDSTFKSHPHLCFIENLSSLPSSSLDCHVMGTGFPGREYSPFCRALLHRHGKPEAPTAACSLCARALGATGVSGCLASTERGHPAWATSQPHRLHPPHAELWRAQSPNVQLETRTLGTPQLNLYFVTIFSK